MDRIGLKLEALKNRLAKIGARPDAMKSPGVMNKIRRQIKRLEKEVG